MRRACKKKGQIRKKSKSEKRAFGPPSKLPFSLRINPSPNVGLRNEIHFKEQIRKQKKFKNQIKTPTDKHHQKPNSNCTKKGQTLPIKNGYLNKIFANVLPGI